MPVSFLFYIYNGLTFSDFILCQSIYNAACLLGRLFMGFLGDIFPKKNILIFAYFLFMMRVILWINFKGFFIVIAGEILYAFFKAFYKGNVDSYVYEYLEQRKEESKMTSKYGRFVLFTSLGSAVSCFLGVILYEHFSFKIILMFELITQILAVICLFLLPDIPVKNSGKINTQNYLQTALGSIKYVFTNAKINYYVYYSAVLTGLISIFVWNFQPMLKIAAAPVILFGVINFINQALRALSGLTAGRFLRKFQGIRLVTIQYAAVIISFILLFSGYKTGNYMLVFINQIIISIAILLFMIFNIFTITKVHENSEDKNRASAASIKPFTEDFMSFFMLFIFKFLYDKFGIMNSIILSAVISAVILFPAAGRKAYQPETNAAER